MTKLRKKKQELPTIEELKKLTDPTKRWYHFRQNNSGGYFNLPGVSVYIRADSSEEAWSRLSEQPGFSEEFCECCGERWFGSNELSGAEMIEDVQRQMSSDFFAGSLGLADDVPYFAIIA